jgi:hypothetical protein
MLIFDFLADIISKKSGNLLDDSELEKEFIPYMIQRWLSMYSTNFLVLANYSTNIHWRIFQDKQEWYKYFLAVFPKSVNKRIPYIKKTKKETTSKGIDKAHVQFLAERLEISQREINQYIQAEQLTNAKLEKLIGE